MDYGLNVIGGATFGAGAIQPFAQARITFGEHLAFPNKGGEGGSGYALMAGVLPPRSRVRVWKYGGVGEVFVFSNPTLSHL